MAAPTAYPDAFKARVHELYHVQNKPMQEALVVLKTEFPQLANRITSDRMHSVANTVRRQKGVAAKNVHTTTRKTAKGKSKGKGKGKGKGVKGPKRKEIIESARKLRLKNYRWQAIVEELFVQFPEEQIPPAGALASIVRGKKFKSSKQYHIAITGPNGVVLNIDVSSNKSLEKIIAHILEA